MTTTSAIRKLLCTTLTFALLASPGCDDDPASSDVGRDLQTDETPDVSDDFDGEDLDDGCPGEDLTVSETGIGIWSACPNAWVELLPRVSIGGEWVGGGADSACSVSDSTVSCPAEPYGVVVAEAIDSATVAIRFEADAEVTVDGLDLSGPAWVEGATGWLSNGFQSWSQSGVVALGPAPDDAALRAALSVRGNVEVGRSGQELSWFYTAAGGGAVALVAGALSAEIFRPWIQLSTLEVDEHTDIGALYLRLVAGDAGESVAVEAGGTIDGPNWRIEIGDELEAMLSRYGDALPHRDSAAHAEAGWNSWYELWDDVDEAAVRANASLASEVLSDLLPSGAPPLRVVVDDGWQELWGEWEPNDKFPSGLDGLASDLAADGFELGVWLAPFLVDDDSELVSNHPDWFVDGATYDHLSNGPMRVLDVTHPDAAAHLSSVIERIVSWGYSLLKIDFLFAATWEGERYADVTGMEAYNLGMQIIREAAGEETLLLAVGAPPLPTFRWVDAWRLGGDIAVELLGASWFFVPSQARSIASRWHLCRAVLCDADPPLLRDLPRNEVEVGAWIVALAGGALFLSDDLRVLPEERRSWGLDVPLVAVAIGGEPSVPTPFFPEVPPTILANAFTDHVRSENGHVVPAVWATPDGRRVAINFSDDPIEIESTTIPPRSAILLAN